MGVGHRIEQGMWQSDRTPHCTHVLGHVAQKLLDIWSHLTHCLTLLYKPSPRSHTLSMRCKSSLVEFWLKVTKAVLSLGLLYTIRGSNHGFIPYWTLCSSLYSQTGISQYFYVGIYVVYEKEIIVLVTWNLFPLKVADHWNYGAHSSG